LKFIHVPLANNAVMAKDLIRASCVVNFKDKEKRFDENIRHKKTARYLKLAKNFLAYFVMMKMKIVEFKIN
jgi:hypothetical protein